MKLKVIIMFKNGTIKTLKSTSIDNESKVNQIKEQYENYFKDIFKENSHGFFRVKSTIIRCDDVSHITIKKVLL